jgi:hypothetical protein
MKKKEFEAIGKRLLPYLPGFGVKGDILFIQPLGHTLRAIAFNGSIDPRSFYVQVFIQPLFVPMEVIGFNIGWRARDHCDSWNADDPNLIARLGTALERDALPFLSGVRSYQDVARAAERWKDADDPYVQQAIAYALARSGDVQRATAALDLLVKLLDTPTKYPWQHALSDRALGLKKMLLSDPAAAQRQLDAWEVESARNLGLVEYRE